MELNKINDYIYSLPTVISLKKILEIMGQLMQIDNRELAESKDVFFSILSELSFKHTNFGYAEVTIKTERKLIDFCKWLVEVNKGLNLELDETYLSLSLQGVKTWYDWFEELDEEFAESEAPFAEMFLEYYFSLLS